MGEMQVSRHQNILPRIYYQFPRDLYGPEQGPSRHKITDSANSYGPTMFPCICKFLPAFYIQFQHSLQPGYRFAEGKNKEVGMDCRGGRSVPGIETHIHVSSHSSPSRHRTAILCGGGCVRNRSGSYIITTLRKHFFGLHKDIVSKRGPQFTSQEWHSFLEKV